jgi:protein dithiol oxidoreductase (disulfide-forming)
MTHPLSNRRLWLSTSLGFISFVFTSKAIQAQPSSNFREGVDYILLPQHPRVDQRPNASNKQVELVNFFWYGCPHCNAFEPSLADWLKTLPSHVKVVFCPVIFRPDFIPHQKLYFALEAIGKVTSHHKKVFAAIHAQNEKLNTDSLVLNWVRKQPEINFDKFAEAYNSFSVATKIQQAKLLQEKYQVSGVPAIGIGEKYYIDGNSAGNMSRALMVAAELIRIAKI